jgi:hypothetical protein
MKTSCLHWWLLLSTLVVPKPACAFLKSFHRATKLRANHHFRPARLAMGASNVILTESDVLDPVVLRDVKGRAIECYVHSHVQMVGDEDTRYIVGVPCDPCIEICEVGDNEEVYTIDESDDRMDLLFPVAAALLEEDDLFLARSAATLTLQGDLEMDEDSNSLVEDEELASFEYEGAEYCILRIVAPLLLVAKAGETGAPSTEWELLQGGELAEISTYVQIELDDQFDIVTESE